MPSSHTCLCTAWCPANFLYLVLQVSVHSLSVGQTGWLLPVGRLLNATKQHNFLLRKLLGKEEGREHCPLLASSRHSDPPPSLSPAQACSRSRGPWSCRCLQAAVCCARPLSCHGPGGALILGSRAPSQGVTDGVAPGTLTGPNLEPQPCYLSALCLREEPSPLNLSVPRGPLHSGSDRNQRPHPHAYTHRVWRDM